MSRDSDFSHLGEILILAEDHGDVVCPSPLQPGRCVRYRRAVAPSGSGSARVAKRHTRPGVPSRSEEHTSELQSRLHLVCRLLLEKKKKNKKTKVLSM